MADETNSDMSLENSPDASNSFEYIQNDQTQSDSPNSDDDDNHHEPHLLKQQTNGQDESNQEETQENGLHGQDQSSSSNDEQVEQEETQQTEVNGQDQSSSFNDEQVEQEKTQEIEINGQDKSNSSNEEEEEEEEIEINDQDKSSFEEEESKPQREIDDDEIPPAELPNIQQEIRHSPRSSPTQLNENNINRPLTKLEDPFGMHQEEQEEEQVKEDFSPIEMTINETINSSTNENLLTEENPLEHPTLLSFLPDIINQTTEQNNIPIETNLSNENPTDSIEVDPKDFTEEDFPPLPKTELPVHQIINDQDFPPLNPPTETTTTDQQQAELEPPLDILKNKSLIKQTLVKGEANTRPSRSTIVTISYSLSLIDSLTSNTRVIEQISNEKYFIGERDLIGAIDVALLSMDRGEKALVESDVRHCYGEQGCEEKHIPPVTTLNPYKMLIEIELHDWIHPIDIQLLSVEERIFWSDKKRLNGNFYYRRQDYKHSLECYQGASRYLDLELNPIDSSIDQNQINLLIEKYIQVQNNLAQTYLLAQKYEDCLNTAANVLKFDPKNVKALFRQGKALFELGKYQEAIQPLKSFLQIQRSNPNVDSDKANQMIQISETKLANYQKSEKEIYQRMFRPPSANNQKPQQQQTKSKKTKQTVDSSNTNWLPYIALGASALAVIGYIAFTKYRKLS